MALSKVVIVNRLLLLALGVVVAALSACAPRQAEPPPIVSYEDGVYRGVFIDRNEIQVGVEFALENNRVKSIGFRHLRAQGDEYRLAAASTLEARLRDEYVKLLEHLLGKDLRVHLTDLYAPEGIADDVDGLTAATMRSSKLISAIRDGLNRGVYSY